MKWLPISYAFTPLKAIYLKRCATQAPSFVLDVYGRLCSNDLFNIHKSFCTFPTKTNANMSSVAMMFSHPIHSFVAELIHLDLTV